MATKTPPDLSPLLTSKDTAALLAVSESTLSRWRRDGVGVPSVNLAGIPRYRREDIAAWLEGNRT